MKSQNKQLVFSAAVLILVAAISRLVPHPPNFAPIASLAVFGGSVIGNKKYAFILPLGALILSDILFEMFTTTPGFYGMGQLFVYGAFLIITLLATTIKKVNTKNIVWACIWSGAIFFIVSNLGVWATSSFYPKNVTGLMSCYAAAIPFYKNEFFGNVVLNSFMGNFFYSALLFGAYAAIKKMAFASNTSLA